MQNYNETLERIRYIIKTGGTLSDDEQALYQQWLDTAGEKEHEHMTWENIELLLTIKANKPTWDEVQQRESHKAVALPSAEELPLEAASPGFGSSRRRFMWMAAATVLLIAMGWIGYLLFRPPSLLYATSEDYLNINRTALILANNSIIPLGGKVPQKEYHQKGLVASVEHAQDVSFGTTADTMQGFVRVVTGTGDSCRVRLPDGTCITLNARSMLEIPLSYRNEHRTVNLFGEAYFDVAKNIVPVRQSSLFRIMFSGREVVVRGTTFNVRSYGNDSLSTIALLSGKLQVVSNGDTTPVEPGKKAIIDRSGAVHKEDFKGEDITGWRSNRFYFQGATLWQIMHTMERHYPVKVVFQDEFPGVTFNLDIAKPKDFSTVLSVLSQVANTPVRFTTKDSTIYVFR